MQACLNMALDTPPGQQSNVVRDIQGILSNTLPSDQFAERIRPVLDKYTHEQLLPVQLEHDQQHDQAILCEEAKVLDRYYHPRMSCTFTYDPVEMCASNVTFVPRAVHDAEKLRAAVDDQLGKYVYNHYHTGVSSVFLPVEHVCATSTEQSTEKTTLKQEGVSQDSEVEKEAEIIPDAEAMEENQSAQAAEPDEADSEKLVGDDAKSKNNSVKEHMAEESSNFPTSNSNILTLHIVGNKYNLRNFWAGRWRSTYEFDVSTKMFRRADLRIQTHYFENGNVQMQTQCAHQTPEFVPTSPDAVAKDLVRAIEVHEQAYQLKLVSTIETLRERAFKALRRTLPLTRQKIDWDKAVSYKIGSELAK